MLRLPDGVISINEWGKNVNYVISLHQKTWIDQCKLLFGLRFVIIRSNFMVYESYKLVTALEKGSEKYIPNTYVQTWLHFFLGTR